jgi:hypothetical protein
MATENKLAELLRKLACEIRAAGKKAKDHKFRKTVKCAQAAAALGLLARKLGA